MKRQYITHYAKSSYAYNIDLHTLHIRVKTNRDIAKKIEIIYGDPFMWGKEGKDGEFKWLTASTENVYMKKELSTTAYDYWHCEIHSETKRIKYAFIINDQYLFGSRDFYDLSDVPKERFNLFNYFNFPYLLDVDTYKAPKWVKDTVWYSIFPDRFNNVDNDYSNLTEWESVTKYRNDIFFGGNLKGITSKLDYLSDLGITGIYLNPIFKSPTAHKYDTIDYFEIDELFGSKEDLKTLIEKAHSLNIKVMLDAVFNHCSHLHEYFQDVIKNEEKSIYKNCFYIKKFPVIDFPIDDNGMPIKDYENPQLDLNYETFAFSKGMPKINTEDPIMREHLLEVGRYWIREFDIDGWRLDVANEVSHDFWREFRKEMLKERNDIFILGENWDNSQPWLNGDQHDAVMNYEFMYPIWSYFGTNITSQKYTGQRFVDKINNVLFSYPKHTIINMFNIIDSHDTARILNICDENKELTKLVYLFQFSLPGSPSIYYGGEIGLSGKHDPDNRRCMIWDRERQDLNMYTHIKRLIELYNQFDAFKSPNLSWINYSDNHLFYQKEDLYFIINKSDKKLSVPSKIHGKYVNIYTDEKVIVDGNIELEPYSFLILK